MIIPDKIRRRVMWPANGGLVPDKHALLEFGYRKAGGKLREAARRFGDIYGTKKLRCIIAKNSRH